jgi:hypothetical protein
LENNFLQIINETIQNKKWESFSAAANTSQVDQEWNSNTIATGILDASLLKI